MADAPPPNQDNRDAPEHILCASIYHDTGEAWPERRSHKYPKTGLLFNGWRHGDCFVSLVAWAGPLKTQEELEKIIEASVEGFLTSKGRFVTRDEAMAIAKSVGQITRIIGGCLTSEDLY